jgi:hypothetical protein
MGIVVVTHVSDTRSSGHCCGNAAYYVSGSNWDGSCVLKTEAVYAALEDWADPSSGFQGIIVSEILPGRGEVEWVSIRVVYETCTTPSGKFERQLRLVDSLARQSCLSLAFSIGGDPGLVRLDRFGAGRKGVSRSAI